MSRDLPKAHREDVAKAEPGWSERGRAEGHPYCWLEEQAVGTRRAVPYGVEAGFGVVLGKALGLPCLLPI